MEVLSDPERFGKRWVSRMAGTAAVPAVVAHAATSSDPYLQEVRSVADSIKNRVPVLSEGLPVRRNVWGDPVERGESLGPDYLSPVFTSKEKPSPLLREVARLKAPLSMPSRKLRIDGQTVELSANQYEWREMDADTRRDFLKETMKEFRASAREDLKELYPDLAREADEVPALPPWFEVAR